MLNEPMAVRRIPITVGPVVMVGVGGAAGIVKPALLRLRLRVRLAVPEPVSGAPFWPRVVVAPQDVAFLGAPPGVKKKGFR